MSAEIIPFDAVPASAVKTKRESKCSFCGKPEKDVKQLIAGPNGRAICERFIAHCKALIAPVGTGA